MSQIIPEPRLSHTNILGVPYPGALCYTYLTQTSTPAVTFSDAILETEHANPVEMLGDGRFPVIYGQSGVTYKFVLTDEDGGNPRTIDPVSATALTQADVGGALYPVTVAEDSAGVTPVDHAYPPGNVLRYGADPAGTTDCAAAFTACFASTKYCFLPEGTFLLNSTVICPSGLNLYGAGKFRSIIKLRNATTGSAALRWTTLASDVVLRDFGVDLVGTGGSALKCIQFAEVRPAIIENIWFVGDSAFGSSDSTLLHFDGSGTFTGEVDIIHCLFNNSKYGIVGHGACTTIRIVRNVFVIGSVLRAGTIAIIFDGTLTAGVYIAGNQIEQWDIGIYLSALSGQVRQVGNYFENNDTYDFQWLPGAFPTGHVSIADINPGTARFSIPYNNVQGCVVTAGSYGDFWDSRALSAYRGFIELGLSVAMGYGTTPTFAAGNFTATIGTWTVIGGGVTTYTYSRKGGEMTVAFSVSGTAAASPVALQIAIPGGLFPAVNITNPIMVTNGGTRTFGFAQVVTSAAVINCYCNASGSTAWTNGTVAVEGEITFRIIS